MLKLEKDLHIEIFASLKCLNVGILMPLSDCVCLRPSVTLRSCPREYISTQTFVSLYFNACFASWCRYAFANLSSAVVLMRVITQKQ